MNRKEQKEQRNQEILMQALDLFVLKGYANTKITDIATACGMSTGLLFHYYTSKEKLYEALVDFGLQGVQMTRPVAIQEPLKYFEEMTEQILTALGELNYVSKIFILMSNARKEGVPKTIREKALEVNNIYECIPLIELGQKMGVICAGDPLSLSFMYWATIQGIAENYLLFPEVVLPQKEWIMKIFEVKENK